MKIEKINDNQIRCTLTKEDLADRELKLSELAYGSEKAKNLFRDMMQQASYEFGFEAEDIPLMIEAIPLSGDCIILIITKVENPEELDTRFSKFSAEETSNNEEDSDPSLLEGADGILDLYKRICEEKRKLEKKKEDKNADGQASETNSADDATDSAPVQLSKLFLFRKLDTVSRLSVILKDFYHGSSSLYKNPQNHQYYLLMKNNQQSPHDFNKTCNILSEYAIPEKYTAGSEAFLKEHYTVIIENTALDVLASFA